MTYIEKLRDPRWQKRRLEVMKAAEFACYSCGATDITLHVHHINYKKGKDPWDYADDELVCMCEICHGELHERKEELLKLIGTDMALLEYAYGYVLGKQDTNYGNFAFRSWEQAEGYAAASLLFNSVDEMMEFIRKGQDNES